MQLEKGLVLPTASGSQFFTRTGKQTHIPADVIEDAALGESSVMRAIHNENLDHEADFPAAANFRATQFRFGDDSDLSYTGEDLQLDADYVQLNNTHIDLAQETSRTGFYSVTLAPIDDTGNGDYDATSRIGVTEQQHAQGQRNHKAQLQFHKRRHKPQIEIFAERRVPLIMGEAFPNLAGAKAVAELIKESGMKTILVISFELCQNGFPDPDFLGKHLGEVRAELQRAAGDNVHFYLGGNCVSDRLLKKHLGDLNVMYPNKDRLSDLSREDRATYEALKQNPHRTAKQNIQLAEWEKRVIMSPDEYQEVLREFYRQAEAHIGGICCGGEMEDVALGAEARDAVYQRT